jgi:hypothetical protein
MDLSNSAARLTTSAVAIAPSHHRRLRVRNVNIDARMPQPDPGRLLGGLGSQTASIRSGSIGRFGSDRRFATFTNFWSHPADASERLSSNANVRMAETTGFEVPKKH